MGKAPPPKRAARPVGKQRTLWGTWDEVESEHTTEKDEERAEARWRQPSLFPEE